MVTCEICTVDGRGLSIRGCSTHFPPEEVVGYCLTCLADPGLLDSLAGGNLYHDHSLTDRTTHRCFFSPLQALARLETSGDPEVKDLVTALDDKLTTKRAKDSELRTLKYLCKTCGGNGAGFLPWAKATVEYLKAKPAPSPTDLCWLHLCPGCGRGGGLTREGAMRQCSMSICTNCLEASGEATKTCVVCRLTLRGGEALFPGKPGFDHSDCVVLMRKHINEPGALGSFDLCSCAPVE
jgi:hypothetical protein